MTAGTVRWIVIVHMAALTIQIGLAFLFLLGADAWSFRGHAEWAWLVLALGILQFLTIMLYDTSRFGSLLFSLAGALIAGEACQIYLGYSGLVPWHVSLAIVIWGAAFALLVRVSSPAWVDAGTR